MHIKILEDVGSKVVFELDGATHTICNALKQELYTDSDVKVAGYSVSHPYVGKPHFVVELKRGADAKKAVIGALSRIKKESEDLSKKAVKELK